MSAFLPGSLKILYKNFLAKTPFLSGLGNRGCFMKILKNSTFLLCLICITGCQQESKPVEKYVEPEVIIEVERNYSEVKDYELVWEAMFDVDLPNYFVYFYSPTCSHCNEIKNFMIEKALDRGNIYFVKASSKDQITNDPKKQKYAENPGDIWILGHPTMIKILNKRCIKYLTGTAQIKTELN